MSKRENRQLARTSRINRHVNVVEEWGNRIFGRDQAEQFKQKFLWPFFYDEYYKSDLIITLDFGGQDDSGNWRFRSIHPTAAMELVGVFVRPMSYFWTPEEFMKRIQFVNINPFLYKLIEDEVYFCAGRGAERGIT